MLPRFKRKVVGQKAIAHFSGKKIVQSRGKRRFKGKNLEQIEQLLAEAQQDAVAASDEAMRLIVEFGNDSLLMEFVATGNQYKTEIRLLSARLQQLREEAPSPTRNVRVQLLFVEAGSVRNRAGRFKEIVLEIGRND